MDQTGLIWCNVMSSKHKKKVLGSSKQKKNYSLQRSLGRKVKMVNQQPEEMNQWSCLVFRHLNRRVRLFRVWCLQFTLLLSHIPFVMHKVMCLIRHPAGWLRALPLQHSHFTFCCTTHLENISLNLKHCTVIWKSYSMLYCHSSMEAHFCQWDEKIKKKICKSLKWETSKDISPKKYWLNNNWLLTQDNEKLSN